MVCARGLAGWEGVHRLAIPLDHRATLLLRWGSHLSRKFTHRVRQATSCSRSSPWRYEVPRSHRPYASPAPPNIRPAYPCTIPQPFVPPFVLFSHLSRIDFDFSFVRGEWLRAVSLHVPDPCVVRRSPSLIENSTVLSSGRFHSVPSHFDDAHLDGIRSLASFPVRCIQSRWSHSLLLSAPPPSLLVTHLLCPVRDGPPRATTPPGRLPVPQSCRKP